MSEKFYDIEPDFIDSLRELVKSVPSDQRVHEVYEHWYNNHTTSHIKDYEQWLESLVVFLMTE